MQLQNTLVVTLDGMSLVAHSLSTEAVDNSEYGFALVWDKMHIITLFVKRNELQLNKKYEDMWNTRVNCKNLRFERLKINFYIRQSDTLYLSPTKNTEVDNIKNL